MSDGSDEATGAPPFPGGRSGSAPGALEPPADGAASADTIPAPSARDGTRFAHASEAEMARILDFYAVRWEYEPTTFPILWNLDGEVIESFAPDFYLPELEVFLEMTTLRQRLVRKKNRKLRRLRELYPDIRIKLFYARDFRAMMLKYGRLGLAESLSGTPGQMVPERLAAIPPAAVIESLAEIALPASPLMPSVSALPAPTAPIGAPAVPAVPRVSPRSRPGRRRRRAGSPTEAAAERETGA